VTLEAFICQHCGNLNDIARLEPCPCVANAGRGLEVQRRHRESVRLAKQHDWAGNAADRTRPRVIGEHFGRRRAA
jgi:hypothetical protein